MTQDISSKAKTPWHLWLVGGLLTLFNGLGAFGYLATIFRFEPYLAQFPEEALSYYTEAPLWMDIMWGGSTVGSFVAAVLLLMRKKVTVPVFAISLICSVVAVAYSYVNPVPGTGSNIVFSVIILFIALLLLVYVIRLKQHGVLR